LGKNKNFHRFKTIPKFRDLILLVSQIISLRNFLDWGVPNSKEFFWNIKVKKNWFKTEGHFKEEMGVKGTFGNTG
jgi:hypothetical protein